MMNKERVFSDRLNLLDSKLDKILEILTADKQPVEPNPVVSELQPPTLVELVLAYLGLHELHDKKELMELFEETDVRLNGKVLDPDETAWCAAFEYAICKKAGYLDVPYALNARAFAECRRGIRRTNRRYCCLGQPRCHRDGISTSRNN